MNSPVTLQISLAPSDYRHAQVLLPHQVRTWQKQVSEVLITVDFHRSSGRFSERWEEGREHILPLARSIEGARVVAVDYSSAAMQRVSDEFFGGCPVPAKDFRGGPYYSYFFGLSEATHSHVLHIDSDMFFGGRSTTWIAEAIAYLDTHRDVLFVAPLPGPPTADGGLRSQQASAIPDCPHAFRFSTMSTRLFLMDRTRFRDKVGSLRPRRVPGLRNLLKALVERNPPDDLPEHLFTDVLRSHRLQRIEFLGTTPGMWSLHPPYRCREFYSRLSELVHRVESGDMPDAQRGDHDLNASLVDWSEAVAALQQNRWWKRLPRKLCLCA